MLNIVRRTARVLVLCAVTLIAFQAGKTHISQNIRKNVDEPTYHPKVITTDKTINGHPSYDSTPMAYTTDDWSIAQTSANVNVAFLEEFGHDSKLGSTELEADTVYRFQAEIPQLYWSNSDLPTVYADFYYPSHVAAGETRKMVSVIRIEGTDDPLYAVIKFTAKDDLNLINGNSTESYSTAGGDIEFQDGKLTIKFFTGATEDFDHMTAAASYGADVTLRCNFHSF